MRLNSDEKIALAYDKLKKDVVSSDEYLNFVNTIIENPDFISKVGNSFDDEFSSHLAESFSDLDFVYVLSDKVNMEQEFTKAIIDSVKSEDAISSIIMVKLLEYYYGNSMKEEIDAYDELLQILLIVFDVDTLIESLSNNDILYRSFSINIDNDRNVYNQFVSDFTDVYNMIKDEKDYNKMIDIISANKDKFEHYVVLGLENKKQINDEEQFGLDISGIFNGKSKKNM